jgi:hypothetical protein
MISALLAATGLMTGFVSPAAADVKPVTIVSKQDPRLCIDSPDRSPGGVLTIQFCDVVTDSKTFVFTDSLARDGGQLRTNVFGTRPLPNLCIDGHMSAGPLTLQTCDNSRTQRWRYTPTYELRNPYGLCIDIPGGNPYPGASLISYPCHGGLNQFWSLVVMPDPG